MKSGTKKILLIALTLSLVFALAGVAFAANETTAAAATSPNPTLAPATVTGSISGTVVHVEANDIVINMDNGNTILFMMNYLHTTDAAIGDTVTVEYSGDIIDLPEAVSITVTKKAVDDLSISGTLMMHDKNRVFVEISSQSVFGFTVSTDTTITGVATELNDGDTVKVTYSGDLDSIPHALNIEIVTASQKKAAPSTDKKDNPVNKHLDGYVTALSSRRLTLHTNSGHSYSFKLVDSTDYTGSYALEEGCKVRVTYDGYAGKGPDAKIVKTIAPPDPNPPSPTYHTTSGIVDSFYGVFLTLENGEGFNVAGASFSGNSSGEPGDKAKITYYCDSDGTLRAVSVVFTAQIYYQPGPVYEPEPDPVPEPDIMTGPGPVIGGGASVEPPIGQGVIVE